MIDTSFDFSAATKALMHEQVLVAETTSDAAAAFAAAKRRVDAQTALHAAHARMETELINSLRQLTLQLKP